MARTAAKTASILREIYDEDFNGEESEPYRFDWDQLRGIAGAKRLTDEICIGMALVFFVEKWSLAYGVRTGGLFASAKK